MYNLYINKSIKSCLKKYVLRARLKDGLNVSDLHWKTVPQFQSSRLEGAVKKCG